MEAELWAIGTIIFSTMIGSVGSLYLKKASKKFRFSLKGVFNFTLVFGVFLYVLATLFFIAALSGGDLNVLYPITSCSYIWVSLLSVKFLKERMNQLKWTGIFLIILGVITITL